MRAPIPLLPRRGKTPRHRGVAMILVLIAVVVAFVLAMSFLSSQGMAAQITDNTRNRAQARMIAESGLEMAIAYVSAVQTWRTDRPNGLWLQDQALSGGTFKVYGEDGYYDAATGAVVGDGDLTNNLADPVTLTATGAFQGAAYNVRTTLRPGNSTMIVYGENTNPLPQYRIWTGSAWSSPQAATTINRYPKWTVARSCPTRHEAAMICLNTLYDLYVQFHNGSSWGAATVLSTNVVTSSERPYAIAYEQVSGKALMVYRVGSDGKVHYRTWNGASLTADAAFTPPTSGDPKWLRLVPKPGSNEIVLINLDNNKDISAAVWNGSAFVSGITLETNAKSVANQCMDGAYLGGVAVVAWSVDEVNNFKYRTWNGTSWSGASNGPNLGREPQWIKMAYDVDAGTVLAGVLDSANDIQALTWNGSSWSSPLLVETNTPNYDRRCFDVGFENGTGKGMIVWGRSGVNGCYYRTWNGSSWSAAVAGPALGNRVSVAQITPGPSSGQLFVEVLEKYSGQLDSMFWNGAALESATIINADISGGNDTEAFMVIAPSPNSVSYTYAAQWFENP